MVGLDKLHGLMYTCMYEHSGGSMPTTAGCTYACTWLGWHKGSSLIWHLAVGGGGVRSKCHCHSVII